MRKYQHLTQEGPTPPYILVPYFKSGTIENFNPDFKQEYMILVGITMIPLEYVLT